MRSSWTVPLALGAVLAVALAAGCGGGSDASKQEQKVPADAVAIVGSAPITRVELDRFLAQLEAAFKAQQREFPKTGTPEYETLKNEAVDQLVRRIELAKEAEALGITVTDEEVTKRLDEFKLEFYKGADGKVDEAKYQEELKNASLTEAEIRTNVKARIVSEKLNNEVTKDVKVTDQEVQTFYDEHRDQFTVPESRDVAHILVDTKQEADKLYKQLQDGADFAALAKKNSKDTGSAKDGGKLTDQKGSFVPEFEDVAFALKTGEISQPVESQYGWHIIKALGDTKPETVTPFTDVKQTISDKVLEEKQSTVADDWVTGIVAKYAPQVAYAVGFEPPAQAASTGTTSTAP